MPTARRARIFTRWRLVFLKLPKNCQVFCQTVGGVFLTFLPKIKDGNSICQTAGDALKKGLANPLPTCMLRIDHKNKVFSLLSCCLLPFFFHFAKSEIANYWRSNYFLLGKYF